MAIKKTLLEENKSEIIYSVEADSFDEWFDQELENRLEIMDDEGPWGPNQKVPFISHKQNVWVYIIGALCIVAHIWARATIGL